MSQIFVSNGNGGGNLITLCGNAQSIDVGIADMVTIPLLGSPASYTFWGIATGKAASAHGIGGFTYGTIRSDGATATIINTIDDIINKDLVIAGASFTIVVSGNNVILRGTGSLGSVITWKGCLTYIYAEAGV